MDNAPCQIDEFSESIIPFVITDPLPVVKLSVTGAEPINGAAGMRRRQKSMTGCGKFEQVQIGNIRIRNIPVSALHMRPISRTVFSWMAD